MDVALVYTDAAFYAGAGFDDAWERALAERGARTTRVPRLGTQAPPRFDLCIAHVLCEEVEAFGETLRAAAVLEAAGTPMLNPVHAVLASADKRTNAAVWAAHGVPQPATYDPHALDAWPRDGEPMVLKPALGDGARDVGLVRSLAEVPRDGAWVLQQWVREPRCLRLFATPDRCSLAYEKDRAPGALVTHGTVYPHVFEPPPEVAELARRMVGTLGGGLMGVDVLVDADGRPWALEANAPFGFDVTDPEQGRFVAAAALDRVPALA